MTGLIATKPIRLLREFVGAGIAIPAVAVDAHPYYKEKYGRLQRAKARWDPRNVFHHKQSIELPPTP